MGRLDGRVVIVTGAGRGVGREHALLMAEEGATVVVNDLGGDQDGTGGDVGPAQQVVDEITSMGGTAIANGDSVAEWDSAKRIVDTALETYGDLHAVVNNAGILMGAKGSKSVADADADDLEQIMRVNLVGPVLCCREAVRVMSRKKAPGGGAAPGAGGAIVNVSSGSAVIGRPLLYAASKGALNSFQAGAVDELAAHGIRINAVSPGMTDTELVADVVPTFDFS